jgi:hypothetical protein
VIVASNIAMQFGASLFTDVSEIRRRNYRADRANGRGKSTFIRSWARVEPSAGTVASMRTSGWAAAADPLRTRTNGC